jgi:serralysin
MGVDEIDLSAWPELRSNAQLTFTSRPDGVRILYGDDVLIVKSADGQPIDPASFDSTDLIGDTHIPQNITQGYSGPITAMPELPERPDYKSYIYACARRSKQRRRPKYSIL